MNNRSVKQERHPADAPESASRGNWQRLPEAIKFGDICYQAERYTDALEAYEKALRDTARLNPELAARLHYRIACCYTKKAGFRLALEHLDEARSVLPRHLDKVRLAKIYGQRGLIMQEMGQYGRASRYLLWSRKLLRGTSDHEELGLVELRLGAVYARLGRHTDARDCFLNSLATYRRIDDRSGEALALNNLALFYKNICDYREAVRYLDLARTIFERVGYRQRLVSIHLNLGIVYFKLSHWELCEENLATAERLAHELGAPQTIARVHLAQGNLAMRRRRWHAAEALFSKAERLAGVETYARERLLAREFLGELHLERGDADRAAKILEPCLEDARALAPGGDLVYEVQRRLADVRLAQGNVDEALDLAREAAASASRLGDRYEEAIALRAVAIALVARGESDEGRRVFGITLDGLEEIGDSYQKGMTRLRYGMCLAAQPADTRSSAVHEEAGNHFHRAFAAFLDLECHVLAAQTAFERAKLEASVDRVEAASTYLAKARRVLTPGADRELEDAIADLQERLDAAFVERWSTGGPALTSLREMKRLFQGATNTEAALHELIRLAVTQSGSTRGCVAHFTTDDNLEVVAAHGWPADRAKDLMDHLGASLRGALRENRPVWGASSSDTQRHPDFPRKRFGVQCFVLLPFTLTEQKPGLLYVDKTEDVPEGGYHQGELHLLTLLANLAALSVVERWNSRLVRENEELKRKIAEETPRFVTANPELMETMRLVEKVANSPVSILITGETGTGKGLMAQVIHDHSNRHEHPLVQINCAALPEPLLESELFGHVKGAFTGASYNKVGLFKEADGGTLFLDEVDKTSLSMQAKLLHVMDAKEIRPVGAVRPIQVDTRVICAANTELKARIEAGEFLEDLYYRLNDFMVHVPPLRERPEDIPLLIDYFMKRFSEQYERPGVKLTPEVRAALMEHSWSGNVRELEKTIRRIVVLCDAGSTIDMDLLPPEIRAAEAPSRARTLREELATTERRVLSHALDSRGWNRSRVSRELKISYPSLLKKIREYGLREK
jgi:transcriptional regulator with GAF, ATPase, and Fis domain